LFFGFLIGVPVPDGLDLEMKPDGKTEAHGFLVVVAKVPFPYGAPVDTGIGTTVAVLTITCSTCEVAAEATDTPFPLPTEAVLTLAAAAVGMAVTVTVDRATVTVTGTQEAAAPDARPEAGEFPPAGADEETAKIVTYLVEVEVPWIVVVKPVDEAAAATEVAAVFADPTGADWVA